MNFDQSPETLGSLRRWAVGIALAPAYISAIALTVGIGMAASGQFAGPDANFRLTTAAFDEVGGGARSYETRGVMVQTMDDFWNSDDMGSDRSWRKIRRRANRSSNRANTRKKAQPIRLEQADPFVLFQSPGRYQDQVRSALGSNTVTIPSRSANDLTGLTGGAARHVCVRMCDGYYWPISYDSGNERGDAAKCQNSCGVPTRLFIDSDPGTGLDEMHDRNGRPYRELKNAYRYRNEYVPSCSCKAKPWEQASLNRHRYYSLIKAAKTDKSLRKIARTQKRQVAKLKRKYRRDRGKDWRRIAKLESSFWSKRGSGPRYSLGAREVIVTDNDEIISPIEVLSFSTRKSRKRRRSSRRNKGRVSALDTQIIQLPSNAHGAIDVSDGNAIVSNRRQSRTARAAERRRTYAARRMGLTTPKRAQPRRKVRRRSYKRRNADWAAQAFAGAN